MGTKKRITKDNYQGVALKRSIIACWVILLICFVIKLFGGNFFEIACNSKRFANFCDFIDNNHIDYIIRFISYMLSTYLIIKFVNYGVRKYKLVISMILTLTVWCIKHLQNVGVLNIDILFLDIIDFVSLYVICFMCCSRNFHIKWRILKPTITVALLFIFSMISAITKNLGWSGNLNNSFLVGFIFMIDYYIMIILTYLYGKRRYLQWVNGDGSTG